MQEGAAVAAAQCRPGSHLQQSKENRTLAAPEEQHAAEHPPQEAVVEDTAQSPVAEQQVAISFVLSWLPAHDCLCVAMLYNVSKFICYLIHTWQHSIEPFVLHACVMCVWVIVYVSGAAKHMADAANLLLLNSQTCILGWVYSLYS